jgi:transcriptional regulator with XRE-family HTH domain
MNFYTPPEKFYKAVTHKDLFERLTEIRLAWKLTSVEVGNRIGVRGETLRRWELRTSTPKLGQLIRWCDVLGYELTIRPKECK